MKMIFKDFVPPILKRILKYQFRYGWHGNYSSWEEASRHSTGYGFEKIIDKVTAAALKVKNGEAVYERDGVVYDQKPINFHILTTLLLAAAKNNNRLTVMDYGGSLGTLYYQLRSYLQHLSSLQWGIIEQPAFVKVGKEKFQDDQLQFFSSVEEYMSGLQAQIAVFCSSLQYLPEPYKELEKLFKYNIPFIMVDCTAFIGNSNDRLTIQKVPPYYYEGSYPCWFFSRPRFLEFMMQKYQLMGQFDDKVHLQLGLKELKYEGMLFRLKVLDGLLD